MNEILATVVLFVIIVAAAFGVTWYMDLKRNKSDENRKALLSQLDRLSRTRDGLSLADAVSRANDRDRERLFEDLSTKPSSKKRG